MTHLTLLLRPTGIVGSPSVNAERRAPGALSLDRSVTRRQFLVGVSAVAAAAQASSSQKVGHWALLVQRQVVLARLHKDDRLLEDVHRRVPRSTGLILDHRTNL